MNYGEKWMALSENYLWMMLTGADERSKEVRHIRKELSLHLANASDADLETMMQAHNRYFPDRPKTIEDLKKLRKHHQEKQKNKRRW